MATVAGNAHRRRFAPDQTRDIRQHVGEQHVGAAENVTLADDAVLERREVSIRNVVDVHEVQPGIDECRGFGRTPPRR